MADCPEPEVADAAVGEESAADCDRCPGALTDGEPVFVSVVVAVKNALPELRLGLSGWLETLPRGLELVVVDGGSTDGSREWLESTRRGGGKRKWKLVCRDDQSIAEAWNHGVQAAEGEWVIFMGADDRLHASQVWDQVLARLAGLTGDVDVCLLPVQIVSPAGVVLDVSRPELSCLGRHASGIQRLPHQGAFHRRSMWDRFGPFDDTFAVAADYEFLRRAQSRGACIEVRSDLGPIQMTFGGLSTRSPLGMLIEYRRVHRTHGVKGSRLAWARLFAAAFAREAITVLLGRHLADRLSDRMRRTLGRPGVWTVR